MAANTLHELAWLVVRDADANATATNNATASDSEDGCVTGNDYDGRLGLRISAIFVILLGSFLGAWFPTFAKRRQGINMPETAFFIAKYFGSGVIVATAFIHLLAPANENLSNSCLPAIWQEYSWCEGIVLMTIFALFLVEVLTIRYAKFGHSHDLDMPRRGHSAHDTELGAYSDDDGKAGEAVVADSAGPCSPHVIPGQDHLGHARSHRNEHGQPTPTPKFESYSAQLTAIFILEFGVIFHSIFIGLTLAVSGDEFISLYIVLVFHQTFEGLGLGSRLSAVPWPASKRWTPYLLAIGYAISTPIAIAIGLGIRNTYPPESTTTLIVNGIFDSISAGILIYTGLVELMAHEFIFSESMAESSILRVLAAFFTMCCGAALMALLGKWA